MSSHYISVTNQELGLRTQNCTLPPEFSHVSTIFSSGSHAKSYMFLAEQEKYHLPHKFMYLVFVEEGKILI